MKRLTIFSIFVLLAALLSACGAEAVAAEETPIPPVIAESAIIAEGRLEPAQYADISFSTGGIVDKVFVTEGAEVEENEIIAILENTDFLEAEVERAEDEVALAEVAIPTEIADAYAALRVAQERFDNYSPPGKFDGMTPVEAADAMLAKVNTAREAYEPYFGTEKPKGYIKDLKEVLDNAWDNYNRALEWMNREIDLEAAKVRLNQALADYESLQAGRDIAAQRNLSVAENTLANAELRSPISGTVASLNVKAGETVNMGQANATVADFSNWLVKTTDLTELDVINIAEGQQVTVTLDAMPESPLTGTVLTIGQIFAESQGDIIYEVTIALDESLPEMRWGMTAVVKFAE